MRSIRYRDWVGKWFGLHRRCGRNGRSGMIRRENESRGSVPAAAVRSGKRRRMLVLEGGAFAGKENFAGRVDAKFFRVVALIDSDADAAARILIEKRIADGHVHEGFAERKDEGFAVELEADLVADGVAERAEIVAQHVGDERAEGVVEADDVAGDSFFFDDSGFRREANEFGYLRAGDGVIPSSGEMRGGGRKNITAMKRGRNGGSEHPG